MKQLIGGTACVWLLAQGGHFEQLLWHCFLRVSWLH